MNAEDQLKAIGNKLTIDDLDVRLPETLHRLRQREPVSWISTLNAWLVTRYDLAIEVMRDAKTYTVDHPGFSTAQVVGPSMLSLDGAHHMQHRRPFEFPFRRRSVEERFTEPVSETITDLIDQFYARGTAELRRDYAGPIAVRAMITALGLEDTPVDAILQWYDTIVDAVTRVTAGEPVSVAGREAYAALHSHLMPSLSKVGGDNLLAAASGYASDLTADEIISNAAILLFGGIETTEGMIANAIYHLLNNAAALEALQNDPDLIAPIVDESLRLEPAASVVDRYTTREVELEGMRIGEGELVRVSLIGANRDPAIFSNPDTFDYRRPNLRSHVTFAQGPHVCLGVHLARLEAEMAVWQAVSRLNKLKLVDRPEAVAESHPRGLVFRKPTALAVEWVPS